MRNYLLTILMIGSGLFAQDRLTLEESLRIGIQNSKKIKIASSKLSASNARYDEYSAQRLPKLTAGGNYFWISDPPVEFDFPSLPGTAPSSNGALNILNANITLEQPLFTGLRLSSLKNAAEYDSKAEEVKYRNAKNEKAIEIHLAFWNFYKAANNLKSIEENLRSLTQNLETAGEFLKNGLATKSDFLRLKVAVSAAELELINSRNELDLSRVNFNRALGLDLQSETEIYADLPQISEEYGIYEEYLTEAFRNRSELKEMEYRISASSERIDAAGASWYPQLNAFGSFYMLKINGSSIPVKNDLNNFWVVGLNLNWNIWNWGITSAQSTQAEELKIQTELSNELMKEVIETEVYRSYMSLKSAKSKYELSEARFNSADENYRISKERYKSNVLSISELIEAEADLLEAKFEVVNSIVDYRIARLMLEKSIGRKLY